ncbi:MAG: oligosaccharide flippase family protein [Bacteroidetes bacterium]|nr:oligosaccharide flippase family protein [Bacteroidota bacterium]
MEGILNLIKSKSFASLAGNGVGALLGIFSFALIARYLPESDFGAWILFLATYSIFETLRAGMILNALIRNFAHSSNEKEKRSIVGSALVLSSTITVIYLAIIGVIFFIFYEFDILIKYQYFFGWYAIFAVVSLPHNFSSWYLNAKLEIISMSVVKLISQVMFIMCCAILFYFGLPFKSVFWAYLLAQTLASMFCIVKGWAGISSIYYYTKNRFSQLFHFGKYSMGTLIGANLIRNSDNYIIGGMLTNSAVAIYSIPSRVIEIIELPIRSFAVTTLPLLAKVYAQGDKKLLKHEFERKAGFLFLLLLPLSIGCLVFAPQIIWLISGDKYQDSVIILRLFSIYTAIIPLDKFSGIMLDIINKPEMNFIKVMVMLIVNIIGDYIGIFEFGTIEAVAIVSTFTFGSGMIFGFFLLHKYLEVSFINTLKLGLMEFKVKYNQITNK